jgi:AcrR family transcriptional regulator
MEDRIVEAAIACIERDGIHRITIRGIAREAGVNSAAISYYFRSEKKLVEEALRRTLSNAFGDWEALFLRDDADPVESLRTVLQEMAEGLLRYPGMVRAHLYGLFLGVERDTPFTRRFAEFLRLMEDRWQRRFPRKTEAEVRSDLVQMTSAVMLPGVFPALFPKPYGAGLRGAGERRAYVQRLVARHAAGGGK